MRSILILITILNLLCAKDINHKVQSIEKDATSSSSTQVENDTQVNELRASREDTTTIWFEDFEGDISGWIIDSQWEITETESNSPTHSLHIDDSNYDIISTAISPVMTFRQKCCSVTKTKGNFNNPTVPTVIFLNYILYF